MQRQSYHGNIGPINCIKAAAADPNSTVPFIACNVAIAVFIIDFFGFSDTTSASMTSRLSDAASLSLSDAIVPILSRTAAISFSSSLASAPILAVAVTDALSFANNSLTFVHCHIKNILFIYSHINTYFTLYDC